MNTVHYVRCLFTLHLQYLLVYTYTAKFNIMKRRILSIFNVFMCLI